jgi:hypothetical protein
MMALLKSSPPRVLGATTNHKRARLYLDEGSASEQRQSVTLALQGRAGPFFANLGGFLMALIYGLPGIQVTGKDSHEWPQRPVVLPEGWKAIEIDRVWIQGQPRRIRAAHGARRAEILDP